MVKCVCAFGKCLCRACVEVGVWTSFPRPESPPANPTNTGLTGKGGDPNPCPVRDLRHRLPGTMHCPAPRTRPVRLPHLVPLQLVVLPDPEIRGEELLRRRLRGLGPRLCTGLPDPCLWLETVKTSSPATSYVARRSYARDVLVCPIQAATAPGHCSPDVGPATLFAEQRAT